MAGAHVKSRANTNDGQADEEDEDSSEDDPLHEEPPE